MFETVLAALQATGIPFEAYGWDNAPSGTYGVVSLEGQEDSVAGDNRILHQSIRGSIDLFVADIGSTAPKVVQDAINGLVPWELNSIQYEYDTRLIHYEWRFNQEGF